MKVTLRILTEKVGPTPRHRGDSPWLVASVRTRTQRAHIRVLRCRAQRPARPGCRGPGERDDAAGGDGPLAAQTPAPAPATHRTWVERPGGRRARPHIRIALALLAPSAPARATPLPPKSRAPVPAEHAHTVRTRSLPRSKCLFSTVRAGFRELEAATSVNIFWRPRQDSNLRRTV